MSDQSKSGGQHNSPDWFIVLLAAAFLFFAYNCENRKAICPTPELKTDSVPAEGTTDEP